jgi:error-prone DNA polymerase
VNALQREHADDFLRERNERPFVSLGDFRKRALLTKDELRRLANLGALNCFAEHRRAAMWRVEETPHDDLLTTAGSGSARVSPRQSSKSPQKRDAFVPSGTGGSTRDVCATQNSPLAPMTLPERVRADYEVMELTTGPHPMKLVREQLADVWRATDLAQAKHGSIIRIAGNVICRQRPGTAKPDLFEQSRLLITEEPFLAIEGEVQNTDNVVLIKAQKIFPLISDGLVGSESHDFR